MMDWHRQNYTPFSELIKAMFSDEYLSPPALKNLAFHVPTPYTKTHSVFIFILAQVPLLSSPITRKITHTALILSVEFSLKSYKGAINNLVSCKDSIFISWVKSKYLGNKLTYLVLWHQPNGNNISEIFKEQTHAGSVFQCFSRTWNARRCSWNFSITGCCTNFNLCQKNCNFQR